MIDVYLLGKPSGQFPVWKWRNGNQYCLRLAHFAVFMNSRKQHTVFAHYKPLFTINQVGKSEIDICIFIGNKIIVSYIGKHPWIQVINDDTDSE